MSTSIQSKKGKALTGELLPAPRTKGAAAVRDALSDAFKARIGQGRPKGAKNKTTRKVQDMLMGAYDKLGGDKAFAEWARANKTEFYKMFGKMLPAHLKLAEGDNEKGIHIHITQKDAQL